MARAMLFIAVPAGIVEAVVTLSTEPTTGTTTSTFGTSSSLSVSSAGTSLAGSSINTIIGVIVAALAVTTLFNIVGATYVGQVVGWRQAVRSGTPRLWSAVWISVLSTLVVVVLVAVVVLVVVIVRAVSSLGVAVLVAAVLGLPVFCLLIWFSICAQLATPALMLEHVRGGPPLSAPSGWCAAPGGQYSAPGCSLGVLVGIATGILSVFFLVALVAVGGHSVAAALLTFVLRTLILVLLTPLMATLSVVLLIDMRVRKEGLDLVTLASALGTTVGPSPLPFVRRVVYGPPGTYGPPGRVPTRWGTPALSGRSPTSSFAPSASALRAVVPPPPASRQPARFGPTPAASTGTPADAPSGRTAPPPPAAEPPEPPS